MNDDFRTRLAEAQRNARRIYLEECLTDLVNETTLYEVAGAWENVVRQCSTPPAGEQRECICPLGGDYYETCPVHRGEPASGPRRTNAACTMAYPRACNDVHCPVHGTDADEQ